MVEELLGQRSDHGSNAPIRNPHKKVCTNELNVHTGQVSTSSKYRNEGICFSLDEANAKLRKKFLEELQRVQVQVSQPSDEVTPQASQANKERRDGVKVCRIEKWLEGFVVAPPQNIFYTGHWRKGPFKYWSKNHNLIRNSLHNIKQNICDMSVKDIFLKTWNIPMERLIYVGPWNDLSNYYYDIPNSIKVLNNLLLHQFPDKYDREQFVLNLYQVLNRSIATRNCMFILGETNSGKNFFFDCVCHALINFGCMGNFNKYDKFPLQECVQRRVIMWNGPNFESASEKTLKLLFGGETFNVKVKYQPYACMFRTPIIILSNNDYFPKTDAFCTHMFSYKWKRAPFLKHYKKKPHPLAIFYIFLKYKVMKISTLEKREDLIQ